METEESFPDLEQKKDANDEDGDTVGMDIQRVHSSAPESEEHKDFEEEQEHVHRLERMQQEDDFLERLDAAREANDLTLFAQLQEHQSYERQKINLVTSKRNSNLISREYKNNSNIRNPPQPSFHEAGTRNNVSQVSQNLSTIIQQARQRCFFDKRGAPKTSQQVRLAVQRESMNMSASQNFWSQYTMNWDLDSLLALLNDIADSSLNNRFMNIMSSIILFLKSQTPELYAYLCEMIQTMENDDLNSYMNFLIARNKTSFSFANTANNSLFPFTISRKLSLLRLNILKTQLCQCLSSVLVNCLQPRNYHATFQFNGVGAHIRMENCILDKEEQEHEQQEEQSTLTNIQNLTFEQIMNNRNEFLHSHVVKKVSSNNHNNNNTITTNNNNNNTHNNSQDVKESVVSTKAPYDCSQFHPIEGCLLFAPLIEMCVSQPEFENLSFMSSFRRLQAIKLKNLNHSTISQQKFYTQGYSSIYQRLHDATMFMTSMKLRFTLLQATEQVDINNHLDPVCVHVGFRRLQEYKSPLIDVSSLPPVLKQASEPFYINRVDAQFANSISSKFSTHNPKAFDSPETRYTHITDCIRKKQSFILDGVLLIDKLADDDMWSCDFEWEAYEGDDWMIRIYSLVTTLSMMNFNSANRTLMDVVEMSKLPENLRNLAHYTRVINYARHVFSGIDQVVNH